MVARSPAWLLLAILGSGCASAPATQAAAPKLGSVKESYESFKEAIAREDYDAAYETLSSDTRGRYPSQLFWIAFNMTSTGQRYQQLLAGSVLVSFIEKSDGQTAVAVLRAKAPEGGYEMRSFRVVKENDERWLVQFTLQEFFGIPEDQFFDIGKVAEKRDFRHRR